MDKLRRSTGARSRRRGACADSAAGDVAKAAASTTVECIRGGKRGER